MASCAFCGEEILPDVERCPLCLKEAPVVRHVSAPAAVAAVAAPPAIAPAAVSALAHGTDEEFYELPHETSDIPAEWQTGALYELELPARCPYCREAIRTIRVLRLRRTQVTFTSTLPRGGRVLTCPACERILAAELTAL
jgi:hypothetical protein